MPEATQIQLAADMIQKAAMNYGTPIQDALALSLATQLYNLWMKPGGPQRFIATPGEVAQKFRERYAMDVRCTDIFRMTDGAAS